jgi:hypothetical protein
MSFSLFGARSAPDPARVAELKRWVADAFSLDDGVLIMVTELQCTEPGCPPIETVIALMGGPDGRRQFKLHARIAEITPDQVANLAVASHDHDDG